MREVPVLQVDADLRRAVPAAERELAERVVRAPRVQLPAGRWDPGDRGFDSDPANLMLVLEGLLTFETTLAGVTTLHLRGPGDLITPWQAMDSVLPLATGWSVATGGASAVLLGQAFRLAQQRWPQLAIALQHRFARQAEMAALRVAILSLPRVEHRILFLFWHLAER